MGRDKDTFNRWEAGQSLGKSLIIANLAALSGQAPRRVDSKGYADGSAGEPLTDPTLDPAFKALMLGLPTGSRHRRGHWKDVDTDLSLECTRPSARPNWAEGFERHPAGDLEGHAKAAPMSPARTAPGGVHCAMRPLGCLAAGDARNRQLISSSASSPRLPSMTAEIGALTAMLSIDAPETTAGAGKVL